MPQQTQVTKFPPWKQAVEEFLAVEHRTFARNQLSRRTGQHEVGVEYPEETRLLRHGLGKIELINPVVFSADAALKTLNGTLQIKNTLADFVIITL